MKQITLDIGLPAGPTLASFIAGPNQDALQHLQIWLGDMLPPRSSTACDALPPEGANFALGRPGGENAARPMRSPVPTYLWGESGSGKSHLLHALRDALTARGEPVGWLDPACHAPAEFNPAWSVVLMDDVQAFNAVQQHAAFNWFVNAMGVTDGQPRSVLAAGALPPADLPLRDDLRSRLGWGHVFQLRALNEPERRLVLQQQAQTRGIALPDEVVDFILSRFSRDLGSLSQLLAQLDHYALQTQRAITIPLVRAMLDNE